LEGLCSGNKRIAARPAQEAIYSAPFRFKRFQRYRKTRKVENMGKSFDHAVEEKCAALPEAEVLIRIVRKARFHPDAIAALIGISLRHLRRPVKEMFGTTVEEWAHDLRDKDACALLVQGLRIGDVVSQLGYCDTPHFCHDFKKRHGISPRKYAINGLLIKSGFLGKSAPVSAIP